jgi:hypothetical protein
MKIINSNKRVGVPIVILIVSCFFFSCSSTHKASTPTAGEIKNMVDSSQFVFVADRMSPMRGGTKTLTSTYTVHLAKDSLSSHLPYAGRATQAPMNMTGGGIEFTSSKFSYDVVSKKEDQWDITIKPEDNNDVQQLFFNIFSNGSANLTVTSTHRDPISFSGYVEKIKGR